MVPETLGTLNLSLLLSVIAFIGHGFLKSEVRIPLNIVHF